MSAGEAVRIDLDALRAEFAASPGAGRLQPLGLGRVIDGERALDELARAVADFPRSGEGVVVLAAATPMRVAGWDLRAEATEVLGRGFAVDWVTLGPADGQVHADELIARALELAGTPAAQDRRDDLALVLERFAARGITTIREAGVDGAELELFQAVRDQGRLPLRCDLLWRIPEGSDADAARQLIAAMPQPGPADDPWLRLTGVKAFVDGRIADAAIGDDSDPDHLRMTPADLQMIVDAALARSAGVGCHAVGDAAVRMVLDAYQRALAAGLVADPGRLVVEHALSCTPETIARLAASGVGVSVHPAIVYEFADDVRRHWGAQRTARAAPVRDMVAAGVRVAAGSDGDVPPFDPLRSVSFMVTRSARSGGPIGEGQAVDSAVALDLYTRCGAALLGAGTRRGRLRPGMDADLAVFSADPLSCPAAELPDVEVLATMLGGKPVHDPGRLMEGIGGA